MKLNAFVRIPFIISGACIPAFSQDKNVLISTGGYPPWSSISIAHGGFVSHVIAEAFKRKKYSVSFYYFPWERACQMARKGRCHATSFWADSKETVNKHAPCFFKSDPAMAAKVIFFQLKSNPIKSWATLDDLKQYRIGTMIGETATQTLKQN